jgi:hypothetical protein
LNIIVPSNASVANPLPVMVWIHGGHQFSSINSSKRRKAIHTKIEKLPPLPSLCLEDQEVL